MEVGATGNTEMDKLGKHLRINTASDNTGRKLFELKL